MSSLVCYSADLNKIFKTQIKSSNQLEFNQFNIQSFESGTSSLVWASVDRFVFKSTSNNLQVVKKNQDESLSLLNSIQLVDVQILCPYHQRVVVELAEWCGND